MRAAAYARYSTDRQTENSIEAQLDAISTYCEKNGHIIVSTYVDMAKSATNTDRPDFQRMLSDARAGVFEAVIIYDISRGSRDVADWFGFRKTMMSLGVQVLSATEKLGDISNPNDFLVELINVGLGQHMVLQTRQKSIAGVAQKAKTGAFLGGVAPLGYDIENGVYVVNKWEAEAVREIFARYAEGLSYDSIIDYLAAKGYKGKRGQPIGRNSLHSILANERYIGVYSWNKHHVKYMGKWAGGVPNPDAVRIENAITPIIDIQTWRKVQERMSDNKRNASNSAIHDYLLSGLIECGECGGAYTGKTNTNSKGYTTRYYVCNNKYRTHTCKSNNINADEIESMVVAQLTQFLRTSDPEKIAQSALEQQEYLNASRQTAERELNKLRTQLNNCTKAIKDGIIYPELKEEMADLQNKIALLTREVQAEPKINISRSEIIKIIKEDADRITPENIPHLIKTYITKIYAHRDEIIITGGVNILACGGRKEFMLTMKQQAERRS